MTENDYQTMLSLAAEIRKVDGKHELGASALAEALMPWVIDQCRSAFNECAEMASVYPVVQNVLKEANPYGKH